MTKPKLLLADDSVTIRKVVELTFADEGIEVSTAADANTAMQRFVEIQPDIVLVDVGLEGTNGYQICEMIKADDATKHIPVMLLVGSFEPFDHDEANRVGADGYLTKPFNSIRDLVSRVRMLLEHETEADTLLLPVETAEDQIPSPENDLNQEQPLSTPETEDIDYLYKSSFVETARMEEVDTAHDLLGDAGMDDEMIESSYSEPQAENSFADLSLVSDSAEPTKEFDWSLESIVTEPTAHNQPELVDSENLAIEDRPDDSEHTHGDDNIIADYTSDPTGISDASQHEEPSDHDDPASMDTIEISHAPDFVVNFRAPVAETKDARNDVVELLGDDEEWTGLGFNSDEERDDLISFDEADPAIHETIPYEVGEQPPVAVEHDSLPDISSELIEKIVDRVIKKLSDGVVREIAKVEVPRIAEKLIREALEQEKKD